MIGRAVFLRRDAKSEAEKPFWISYADLMTALMVLFLVAMSVAMMAVTNTVRDIERQKDELQRSNVESNERNSQLQVALAKLQADEERLEADDERIKAADEKLKQFQKTPEDLENERRRAEREKEISALLDEVANAALKHPGVKVDKDQRTIDFGERARFDMRSYNLKTDQARLLREFVPEVLAIAKDELGKKWLKQVVVEGFASPEGDYLFNLNLSLQRSQRVLCVLMAPVSQEERPLSQAQLEQVRDLFLVGGYSFNAAKFDAETSSYDASRRVELRLEFLSVGELRSPAVTATQGNFGKCALDLQ